MSRNKKKPRPLLRRPARPARPVRPVVSEEDLPPLDLLAELDEVIAETHPLALLGYASTMVAAAEPDPFAWLRTDEDTPDGEGDSGDPVDIRWLMESFLDVGLRQTDAVLLVLKELVGDDVTRERIRRDVTARRHPIPGWLLRLDQIHPNRAVITGDVLGDGDNILLGVDLPGRKQLTVGIYIDHNMGTLVKDAFVIPASIEEVTAKYDDLGFTGWIRPMGLADARAHLEQAVHTGRSTFPPFETDTWPACRPLLEWFLRLLPEGGTSYPRLEWDHTSLDQLVADFFTSPHATYPDGTRLDATPGSDASDILHTLIGYGVDYGTGDPLRWSPTNVELILLDWIPRKIIADPDYLTQFPDILHALIRYAHTQRGIPPHLTADTLKMISACEQEYIHLISDPHHQDTIAMLEHLGILDALENDDLGWSTLDPGDPHYLHNLYAEEVGGPENLAALDTTPLPYEDLNLDPTPADIHDRLTRIAALITHTTQTLFNDETRTAALRILTRIATNDPQIFRRKSKDTTTTAAVLWITAKLNHALYPHGPTTQTLMENLGLTGTPTQRAQPMLTALGAPNPYNWATHPTLGDPTLLTSQRRHQLKTLNV